MKDNKAKIYMISSLVVLVIAVIVSGTYAYYVWTTSDSDTTKIVAGIGAATVTFDGGSDISANLRPVSDKSKGIVKNINVKADTTGLVFNMYLDITSIDTGLKDESFRYELYKGTTKVKEGNFSESYLTSNTVTCTKNNTNHIVWVEMLWISLHVFLRVKALASCRNRTPIPTLILHLRPVRWVLTDHPSLCLFPT